jgi:beta-glucosidase
MLECAFYNILFYEGENYGRPKNCIGTDLAGKAELVAGGDFWHTKAVERLNIPFFMMTDGPVGLRKQAHKANHLGLGESIVSVCFPAGVALATSFDRDLLAKLARPWAMNARPRMWRCFLAPP